MEARTKVLSNESQNVDKLVIGLFLPLLCFDISFLYFFEVNQCLEAIVIVYNVLKIEFSLS